LFVHALDVYMLVQILEHLRVDLPPEEFNPHVVRVGFSAPTTSLSLGNEKFLTTRFQFAPATYRVTSSCRDITVHSTYRHVGYKLTRL